MIIKSGIHELRGHAARAFAERVRTGLAAIQPMETLRGKDSVVRIVTVSGGATVLAPSDGDSADSLVRRADEALYEAKRNGRDRIAAAATPSTIASGGTVDRSRRSRPPGPT